MSLFRSSATSLRSTVLARRWQSSVLAAATQSQLVDASEKTVAAIRHTDNTQNVLKSVPAKWEAMPPAEKRAVDKILMAAEAGDWKQMTVVEKRAVYWARFGPHGVRRPVVDPEMHKWILWALGTTLLAGGVLSNFMKLSKAPPSKTQTFEWNEAQDEYMKKQNMNPITGISSEGSKVTMKNEGMFPKSFP